MIYNDFEQALSTERLKRYLDACNNDTRKAYTLNRIFLENHRFKRNIVPEEEPAILRKEFILLQILHRLQTCRHLNP